MACFDAYVMSPPCEEYARAWLPWVRMDKTPGPEAIRLLEWSVKWGNSGKISLCE